MNTIPTIIEHGVVNRVQNTLFSYQGWPSVTIDENGTLYAVSSSFRCLHVCPFGKTAMYISKNGGKTWTPPIVINDTYLDDRDAGILYLGNGRLLVTWFSHPTDLYYNGCWAGYMKNNASDMSVAPILGMLNMYPRIPEKHSKGGSFIRISEDYGVTWSDTIQIPVSAPHGPNVLKDGTILYLGKEMYSSSLETPETERVIAAYASTDGGYTWTRRGLCDKPSNLDWWKFYEPHVIELSDGSLFGMIRAEGKEVNPGFTMYTTRSFDGGCTWTEYKATGISGSPPHLCLHSSGALICSYARREAPYSQRVMISYDNGESWSDEMIIDGRSDNADIGYPATVELPDKSLITVYYQRYLDESTSRFDPNTSILYTKWKLSE